MTELEKALVEYIKFLHSELDETVPMSYTHGWRSTRHEQGVELRERIEEINGGKFTWDTEKKDET